MPAPPTPKPLPTLPPRRPYAALPILWAILVLVLTLTPAQEMPITPVWELLSFDTAAHAGVFVVLAGLSWFSLSRQRRWPRLARHVGLVVVVGSTLFGGLIELLQHTMGLGRQGDWTDLLSDAIGAAVAVGVLTAWASWRARRTGYAAAMLWLTGAAAAMSATPAPAKAQDMPRVRRTIEKLAAPQMHGRGYVKDGDKKAAAYLRGRLKELKLEPLAPDYTQPFTLDVNTFPSKMDFRLEHGFVPGLGPKWRLQPGRDFIATANSGGGQLSGRFLRYLDSVTVSTPAGVEEFLRTSQFKRDGQYSCMVVLLDRYVQQPAHLPEAVRARLDSVAAVLRVVPKLTASVAATQSKQVQLEALPHPMLHRIGAPISSPAWTSTTAIDAQLRRNYQTQNLAAVIRGTAQPDSFLVVTAHYDHLGRMGKDVYFPGANDNASGVALLLELAAHYARPENRPACSVAFLLFGAEEAGLVGSRYFVAKPLVPLQRIKFLVNLDLLGTGEQGATVVNGRLLEAPYQRLVALNDAHRYLPQLAPRGRAANSDHFPFSEAGVPAFFLYTRGGSTAYHDVNDRPEALSLAGFAGAFGLVRDFLNGMGAAK
ncbi:VanZ family protein [Hymenobacter arizonensis]|uniref:Peptidase family M28 n=1 Tax=Hymenobacter arizonensis TaxID=1227077 RepID=A0A1I5WZR7_HYMAR|nr:VanZ family protein [Hymenobacter arizonensis]SFQ25243.1 Peptidase family M28 [Hymenobacter arizonensis]